MTNPLVLLTLLSLLSASSGKIEPKTVASLVVVAPGVSSPAFRFPRAVARWPAGRGQLLPCGAERVAEEARKMGVEWQRSEEEGGFLAEGTPRHGEVRVIAAATQPALATAHAFVHGLYPAASEASLFPVIPVLSVDPRIDELHGWSLFGPSQCGKLREIQDEEIRGSAVWQRLEARHAEPLRRISEALGAPLTVANVSMAADAVRAESCAGEPHVAGLGPKTASYLDRVQRTTDHLLYADRLTGTLGSGALVQAIRRRMMLFIGAHAAKESGGGSALSRPHRRRRLDVFVVESHTTLLALAGLLGVPTDALNGTSPQYMRFDMLLDRANFDGDGELLNDYFVQVSTNEGPLPLGDLCDVIPYFAAPGRCSFHAFDFGISSVMGPDHSSDWHQICAVSHDAAPSASRARAAATLARFDADRDGVLSLAETAALLASQEDSEEPNKVEAPQKVEKVPTGAGEDERALQAQLEELTSVSSEREAMAAQLEELTDRLLARIAKRTGEEEEVVKVDQGEDEVREEEGVMRDEL
jgi:hypothetical protein